MDNPVITPDVSTSTLQITDFEKLYWTNPLVHKAINLRANRVIGDGFELIPADGPTIPEPTAEAAKNDCEKFLKRMNYVSFFRQSIINAYVAGNEWTELIWNDLTPKSLAYLGHGDYHTIDYRRDYINNKILMDAEGQPAGYWQYIADLTQLYRQLSLLFGSVPTYKNMLAAKQRLEETRSLGVYQDGDKLLLLPHDEATDTMVEIARIATKPQYMFIEPDEIAHLSFNNLNDNFYGTSLILPAYNACIQLDQVMFATAEAINEMGYPKPVVTVGDKDHPPTTALNDQAEALVQDPVRKEAFVIPYLLKMEYLQPSGTGSGNVSDYPEWFITAVSIGLRVPRELLTGEGEANRATSMQGSSDFEKDVEADRRVFEQYLAIILEKYLEGRGYGSTSGSAKDYVPTVKWPKFITEDEATREKMVLDKWQAGLINFNEARSSLGLGEVEDRERGESYSNELNQPQQDQGFPFMGQESPDLGAYADQAATAESNENSPELATFTAQHALLPKAELNPALNTEKGTEGVDYKDIAQKQTGKLIVSVSRETAQKIRDILINGEAQKRSPKDIFNDIKKVSGLEDWQVHRILKTEGKNLFQTAHLKDAIGKGHTHKTWDATLEKTCPLCKQLHGKTIPIEAKFTAQYKVKTRKGIVTKTWTGDSPASHPNCNCSLAFSTKGEK